MTLFVFFSFSVYLFLQLCMKYQKKSKTDRILNIEM